MTIIAELSDWNSSKTVPMRFIAITDGASEGLIDTERICPTTSSCGTVAFRTAIRTIQAMMIGTARRRIQVAMADRRGGSAAGAESTVGVLTSQSPRRSSSLEC
ncbi:hypothetical protein MPUL_48390 [Mycolicibacterium pulveris]|uniref:Uncharacterized protein n=1 Tax=Mycolicibacterium pulveris TaxID=36813 RepID=A0A7I7USB5_MYCPV|nr:hypothetical protein MPUL_48390 [Mycolicibacterium pulveris]